MIGITLDEEQQPLQIPEDTTIQITLQNPLLNESDNLAPGSFSMPFSLPIGKSSPLNSRLLKMPHVVENVDVFLPKKATLSYKRTPFKKGNINIDSVEDNRADSYLTFGLNTIKEGLATLKLRDLLDEEINLGTIEGIKEVLVTYHPDDFLMSVAVNGATYQNIDGGDSILDQINDAAGLAAIGSWVPRATVESTFDGYSRISIILHTKTGASTYVPIDDMAVEFTVSVNPNFGPDQIYFSDLDVNLLYYQSSVSSVIKPYLDGTENDSRFSFATMRNPGFFAVGDVKDNGGGVISPFNTLTDDTVKPFNHETYLAASGGYPARRYVSKFQVYQPFIRMSYILTKIQEYLEIPIAGDFVDDCEKMILDNTYMMGNIQEFASWDNLWPSHLAVKKWFFVTGIFNLKDLVPDITVVDFLKAFSSRYNMSIHQDEFTGRLLFTYKEGFARDTTYENIDSIAGRKGKVRFEQTSGYRMIIPAEKNDTDSFNVDQTLTIGIAEEDIPIGVGNFNNNILGGDVSVRRTHGSEFGLRIFYFRSWDSDYFWRGVINQPGADVVTTIAQLHEKYFKASILFRKNKRVVPVMVKWPFRKLINFNWAKKRMYNRSLYLVKSIKLNITNTGVRVSDTELITQS